MPAYQPASRRPIAEVFRRTAQRATRFCVRMGIPADAISYFSIAAAAIAALCFWQSMRHPILLVVAPLFWQARVIPSLTRPAGPMKPRALNHSHPRWAQVR